MPRYFFNVHGGGLAAPDLVGRKLPDDQAARAEAEALAKEVAIAELSGAPFPDRLWVEVVDEEQRPVVLLPIDEVPAAPNRSG